MKRKIYIAYGSNMSEEQMKFRCPDSKLIDTGTLKNWRLMFKGSYSGNYATIEREENCEVPVLIWKISAADEKNLDRYEGCPTFYYKTEIEVETSDGEKIFGIVYIMHEERNLGLPTKFYFNVLRDAYEKFHFDLKILEEALNFSNTENFDSETPEE